MKKSLIASSIIFSMLGTPVFADGLVQAKQAETIQAQASVQAPQAALTEDQASELIKIEKTPMVLQSHIKKRFTAYKVSMISKYPGNLDITSASIDNDVPGPVAAEGTTTSWGNIFWGLPLWLLGMGIAAVVISGKNHRAETEAFQFTNQIPTSPLHKNENISFNALVPIGQNPQIKIRFEDGKTGLSFAKSI